MVSGLTFKHQDLSILAKNTIWTNPTHFLAFGCGLGAMPWAPGTFGTLLGIPLFLVLQPLGLIPYLIATVLLTIIGTWLCHVTGKDIGVTDHPGIVIDEIVGFLWTMVAVPAGGWWILAGFVLFRVFDILKPWPIRWADRQVPGGIGVMLDDILAALYAWIILQVVVWLIP